MARPHYGIPSIERIQQTAEQVFGYKPCLWQVKSALGQLEQQDVITISATGSGKTLNFWLPLLFNGNGIMVLITPLNILGDKNYNELKEIGINGINLTMSTATEDAYREIESLKYQVIITSPECIQNDARFKRLWENKKFIEKVFAITFDESHCISKWGDSFHPEYGDIGNLRWILPAHIPFHITSATMPPHILEDVKRKLQIRSDAIEIICSNDRPNIYLRVEEMKYPINTKWDLLRVL
ncbi:P-loop containing nucleoside triphosphate hydrolase protein [Suillus cothurnatus]|nr:P-loop containing nucleoside triphosphate hydrolase protein [Suillus cothurnatus]